MHYAGAVTHHWTLGVQDLSKEWSALIACLTSAHADLTVHLAWVQTSY